MPSRTTKLSCDSRSGAAELSKPECGHRHEKHFVRVWFLGSSYVRPPNTVTLAAPVLGGKVESDLIVSHNPRRLQLRKQSREPSWPRHDTFRGKVVIGSQL